MKSAAMPAARSSDDARTIQPRHLRLVSAHDAAPRPSDRADIPAEAVVAEDPDEMWDNLPV